MASPAAVAQLVAQAAPGTPQPNLKMNSQASSALTLKVTRLMESVTRARPMPLKKPSTDHRATPSAAPIMRGCQNCSASSRTLASSSKGASIHAPPKPSAANSGAVNKDAHKAVQVAWDARA